MHRTQITAWAPKGVEPTFAAGRWVQLGKPTLLNYWLTGLPGGKIHFSRAWPFVRYESNRTSFDNWVTGRIYTPALITPSGLGPDGWAKALFRQRRLTSEYAQRMMDCEISNSKGVE
jgi:hypothetical protein